MKKYIKDTKITFITQCTTLLIGFIYNILIARILGPDGRGIIAIASLFPFIFSIIAGLGLDEGNVYMIAKDKNNYKSIFSNSIFTGIVMSGLSILFLYLSRNFFLTKLLKNLEFSYFFIIMISIPFFILLHYSRGILHGYRNFVKFNSLFILHHGLNLIFTGILIIKLKIWGAIIAILLSVVISSVVAIFYLLKKYGTPGKLNFKLLKLSLSFGIKNKIGVILDFFNKRLDIFIINYFRGMTETGYYCIAVSFAEILYKLPDACGITLFPKIAQLPDKEGNEFTLLVLKNVFFISIFSAFIYAFIIKPLIFITVGEIFYHSILPFLILLPGIVFMGITRIITSNFQGKGHPEYGVYLTIVSVIFTITLNLMLIPTYGCKGAAVTSTISHFIAAILSLVIFKKKAEINKIKIKEIFIFKNFLKEVKTMLK